jgi:penicillin G amidase
MNFSESPFIQLAKRGMDWWSQKRLAQQDGQMTLPGLRSKVEVIHDAWGVPHIYASNREDLFFAQGFVHAQDRFWQMEFQRRLVAGRLAEVFGPLAVPADRWMRILGMYRTAEQEAEMIKNSSLQPVIEAYVAGVNAYLDKKSLPVEFSILLYDPEPWTASDSLGWSKMMAWMMSTNWESELFRQKLFEKLGKDLALQLELESEQCWPLVLDLPDELRFERQLAEFARSWGGPGPREGVGSNNWVLAGSRTASGKPILANDMHLLLTAPAVWYENHLSAENYNVTGVSLPGIPMIVSGHNGRVAWGLTAGFADVQDLFEENIRRTPEGMVEYEYKGEWLPADVRQEEIRVRGGSSETEEVIVTRHGPIINGMLETPPERTYALKWTANETSGSTFQSVWSINMARDCYEFREGLRLWSTPVLNVVYADVDGNIAYTLAGKVPIRADGHGEVPVEGWSGACEWIGTIPYEEMPHLFNPPSGFIATANNRVAGPDYPYWLGWDYVSGDRAERIIELILSQPEIDLAYIRRMQMDQVSPSAQTIAHAIGELRPEDPRLARVAERMEKWDGTLAADSAEAAIYQVFTRQLLHTLLEKQLGDLMSDYSGAQKNSLSGPNVWGHHSWEWLRREITRSDSPWFGPKNGENREHLLLQALQKTVDYMTETQGPDLYEWKWGVFHKVSFQHQLGRLKPLDQVFNRGPYPAGGDGNTIWATATLFDRVDSTDGTVGPPFRFIADLSDLRRSLGLMAPGNSGQPGSPHYDDQITAWYEGEYHPMFYDREDVVKQQQACLILEPSENGEHS